MLNLHLNETPVTLRALLTNLERVPTAQRREDAHFIELRNKGRHFLVRASRDIDERRASPLRRDSLLRLHFRRRLTGLEGARRRLTAEVHPRIVLVRIAAEEHHRRRSTHVLRR